MRPPTEGPPRPGFRIMKDRCATCIFNPGNPMQLRPGRVKDMVETCRRRDSFVTCHETMNPDGVPDEWSAACKGYLDLQETERSRSGGLDPRPQVLQIAERLNLVRIVAGRDEP